MDNEGIQEASCEPSECLDNDTRALGADGSSSITLVRLGVRHLGVLKYEEIRRGSFVAGLAPREHS